MPKKLDAEELSAQAHRLNTAGKFNPHTVKDKYPTRHPVNGKQVERRRNNP